MIQASYHFPRGFLWGTATAAHQVEGNNTNNQWWKWEQEGHTNGTSGQACDWWGGLEGGLRPRCGRWTERPSHVGGMEPHPAHAGYLG
jgi:hypothetical protein